MINHAINEWATSSSEDGAELYTFDASGRHLFTLDTLTATVLYQFAYDTADHLKSVTDRDGNVTTIARDAAGRSTAIVAPVGQTTQLATDVDGYLACVTDPAGSATHLSYAAGGLLASLTDPLGHIHRFSYD